MPPALIPNDDQSQNQQISFQGPVPVPVLKNWGPKQDAYLAHHWQTLTTSKALNAFKQTIFTRNPRQPSNQCHPLSYDIDFLHDRLSHLLGPCLTEESSFPDPKAIHRYFHSHWHRIERNDWRLYA